MAGSLAVARPRRSWRSGKGEPPFWGEVGRDDVAFNLRHTDDGNLILFGSPA